MRIRRRFTEDLWSRPPHKRQEYLPLIPAPAELHIDHPPDTSSKTFRIVTVRCDPSRLPTGSRIFANLLGFLGRQVGATGTPVALGDGSTAVVIGIHGEFPIDEDAEIMVELEEPEEHQAMPVPQRNIFDFTGDQPVPEKKTRFDFT